MRIMCFMSLFTFVSLSTQGICIIIEKQKYTVAYSICQIIAGIIAFFAIGLLFDNLLLSLAAYTVSVVVIQIVYFCFIYKAVNLSILKYLRNVVLDMTVIIMGTIILRFIAMQFSIVNTIFL